MPKSSYAEAIKFASNIAKRLDPDPAHSEHVTSLALSLFDGLNEIHELGRKERHLLEVAGRLHDIGWSESSGSGSKHHKLSGKLIRGLQIPGLTKSDITACSLIARYHTKAIPNAERHNTFSSLDPKERNAVEWLAGILRVADGLDCTHGKVVESLTCKSLRKTIKLNLAVPGGECRMEAAKAAQKGDLLASKLERDIEFLC